jgi:hypothetical protein
MHDRRHPLLQWLYMQDRSEQLDGLRTDGPGKNNMWRGSSTDTGSPDAEADAEAYANSNTEADANSNAEANAPPNAADAAAADTPPHASSWRLYQKRGSTALHFAV